jgi:uncharacterized protein (DUF58 family)
MPFPNLFSPRTENHRPADHDHRQWPGEVHVSSDELVRYRLQAGEIKLTSRLPARSTITGGHASRFRGRGMDYLESRDYQPGDDIRSMDWRVTARTNRAHVKLYQEERERPVVVMLDLGPGMFFATQGAFKSVIAARAAALIGWAAIQHGDRIGALFFNGVHHELRPLGGQRGVMRLIRQLVTATDPAAVLTSPKVDLHNSQLNEALLRLHRVARPGSLVYILSDFYAMNAETRRHLQRLRQHNDVVACQIVDAIELAPPPPGRYAVTDGAATGQLDTRSGKRRQAYNEFFNGHHQAVRDLMRQCAVPMRRITTTDDVVHALRFGNGVAKARGEA